MANAADLKSSNRCTGLSEPDTHPERFRVVMIIEQLR